MGDSSDGLMQLRPVTFRYKQAFADGSKPLEFGLIAEEVAEVYPDMVVRSANGQIETVKYQELAPMLLNEVQKQRAEIRSLEERLARIEAGLARERSAAREVRPQSAYLAARALNQSTSSSPRPSGRDCEPGGADNLDERRVFSRLP